MHMAIRTWWTSITQLTVALPHGAAAAMDDAAGQQTAPLVGRIPDVWEKPTSGKELLLY
jgi:hypothetical protein